MLINSVRFGNVEVCERDIVRFPQGLPGFPEEKAFAFIPYGEGSPFAFLQSVNEPNLTFLVADPFAFFDDYTFELDDETVQQLNLNCDNSPQIVNIVTVPEKAEDMTTNLLAPVIINRQTRTAAQIVLEKTPYTTKHRLFPQWLSEHSTEGGR